MRWLITYKKLMNAQKTEEFLNGMASKKTICRICEKEIQMSKLKKHSIRCKQMYELKTLMKV